MNPATPLKMPAAVPSPREKPSIATALNVEDSETLKKVFALAPAAFVDAWARALALSEQELTPTDRDIFVQAIRTGTGRLKIVDALYARKWAGRSLLANTAANDICRVQDQFVLLENLEHFAPKDHAAFVRYAFGQICAREPTPTEMLAFDFDLRRGVLDRRTAAKKIVRIASREGRPSLWDSLTLEEDRNDPTCARTLPSGFVFDEAGREALMFVRELSEGGWMVAPDILRQSPTMDRRGWLIQEGWIISGPKRSLRPGRWCVSLDILQQEQVLHVDFVANSGLDVLQQIAICGPFAGSFCVEIESHHRFVELRMMARGLSGPHWINPRNISMHLIA